jgi:hypothetical protein
LFPGEGIGIIFGGAKKKILFIFVILFLAGYLRFADPYDPDRNAPDSQEQREDGVSESFIKLIL